MKIERYLLCFAAFASPILLAAPTYDDWEKKTVNVTQPVQHYGGNYQCSYNQQLWGISPPYTFGPQPQNYVMPKTANSYVNDSLVTRPTLVVVDLYNRLREDNNLFETNPYYPYACQGTKDLLKTYIEQKVIGTKIEYTPVQPFPQFVSYEYHGCNAQRVREGILYVTGINGASNVVIKDITNSVPETFYSGPATSWLALNSYQFGLRWISIKFDNGSSYYLNVSIPQCTGGPNDPLPL